MAIHNIKSILLVKFQIFLFLDLEAPRFFTKNDFSPMKEGDTRKFEIDKNCKPNCQYPEKEITIGKKSHSVKNNNKWIYGVVELDYQAYINCFPGEVDFLFTAGIAQNCGVGKILMKLCLNEEKIHNVENNEENDAMSDLKLSADLSKNDVFKKFVKNIESDCSKLRTNITFSIIRIK